MFGRAFVLLSILKDKLELSYIYVCICKFVTMLIKLLVNILVICVELNMPM